jgi:hypothetical protein
MRGASRAARGASLHHTVVVAVSPVRMVQMTVDQIVDVVAVRNCLVPAAAAVYMTLGMPSTIVAGRAAVRMCGVYFNPMVVHVIPVSVMQMAVVEIIGMALMLDFRVAAIRAMLVVVLPGMLLMRLRHGFRPP